MTWPPSFRIYAFTRNEPTSYDRTGVPFSELDAIVRNAAVRGFETILVQVEPPDEDSL